MATLKIKSNKTGLVSQVTQKQLETMQSVSGKHAFAVVEKDTTPAEVTAAKAKAAEAKPTEAKA